MPCEVNLNLFGESTGSQQLSDVSSYWWSLRSALLALFCRAGGGAGWWYSVVATRLKTPVFCKLEDTCLRWIVGVWLLQLLGASVVTQIPIAVARLRTIRSPWWTLGSRKEWSWLCWDSKPDFHYWILFVHFAGERAVIFLQTQILVQYWRTCLLPLLPSAVPFLFFLSTLFRNFIDEKERSEGKSWRRSRNENPNQH